MSNNHSDCNLEENTIKEYFEKWPITWGVSHKLTQDISLEKLSDKCNNNSTLVYTLIPESENITVILKEIVTFIPEKKCCSGNVPCNKVIEGSMIIVKNTGAGDIIIKNFYYENTVIALKKDELVILTAKKVLNQEWCIQLNEPFFTNLQTAYDNSLTGEICINNTQKDFEILGDNSDLNSLIPSDGILFTVANKNKSEIYLQSGFTFLQGVLGAATGKNSVSLGEGCVSSGENSYSEGYYTTSTNIASYTEGGLTTATNIASHAEGLSTTASGIGSHAECESTTASGIGSHAEGFKTTACETGSHAEGGFTTASGIGSHAEGSLTTASGIGSHSEGSITTASGIGSHAEGGSSTASETGSHAEGTKTTASGIGSHAEGFFTTASETGSHSEGQETVVSSGIGSHAEGWATTAFEIGSHAEGTSTQAFEFASHSEGSFTTASGSSSHSEGNFTIASGSSSHSEGFATLASEFTSHSQGLFTTASASASHSEGISTFCTNLDQTYNETKYQHAEGIYTIASGYASHVSGIGSFSNNIGSYAQCCGTTDTISIANGDIQYQRLVLSGIIDLANSTTANLRIFGRGSTYPTTQYPLFPVNNSTTSAYSLSAEVVAIAYDNSVGSWLIEAVAVVSSLGVVNIFVDETQNRSTQTPGIISNIRPADPVGADPPVFIPTGNAWEFSIKVSSVNDMSNDKIKWCATVKFTSKFLTN